MAICGCLCWRRLDSPCTLALDLAKASYCEAMPHIIALIGMDGVGKTTQARLLVEWLGSQAVVTAYCRNAGGRRWFGRVAVCFGREDAVDLLGTRGMLLVEAVLRWLAIAKALTWSSLRGLLSGDSVVVMDRYSFCQYASIRAHRGRRERVARLLYGVFPKPTVTCYLKVPPEQAFDRIEDRGTDHEDLHYLTTVDRAYEDLPEARTFAVIDATGPIEDVQEDVRRAVAAGLASHRRPVVVPAPAAAP